MENSILKLYPYQQRWIRDKSRFKIGMQARQTGKTFVTTLEIVDNCFEAIANGVKSRWLILSRGERQAREAMEEGIKPHAYAYQLAIDYLEVDYDTGNGVFRALEVVLPGGSRITALPANPDTARGYSGNVFLDEFAFHKDSRQIWQALFPVISKPNLLLRITSTPNGKLNKFYDLMTDNSDKWSKHTTDIYQAVADGLPRDITELKEASGDEDLWRQEFELQWLDEASSWLSYDLINSVEDELAGKPELYEGGPCFLGNDIGRKSDLWVTWVWELIGDVFWCREIRILKRETFAVQDAVLDELMSRYRCVRLCMDETGMGEKPVEDAQRRYGKYRVEGVMFTMVSKLEMATVGKQLFEDKKVRIPPDKVLREDLHKLRRTTTASGNYRFDADTDKIGHADRTWAAFLGLYAAHNQKPGLRALGSREFWEF